MELPSLAPHYEEFILDGIDPPPLDVGNPDRTGALICRSETRVRAGWRATDGDFFSDTTSRTGDIQQIRTDPSLSRLSRGRLDVITDPTVTDPIYNGLFTCQSAGVRW